MRRITIVLCALALAACSQEHAPSEKLAEEATDIVKAAAGEEEAPAASPGPWAPRDECGELADAAPFLAMLRGAIAARDAKALGGLVADDVQLDFGGGAGRAELLARLETPEGLNWDTLAQMMTLGCAANAQGGITIPWYFAQDIPVDPYAGAIVTGQNVPIYQQPRAEALVTDHLSWDAVEVVYDDAARVEGWRQIRIPATEDEPESTGWIENDKLRAIIDYRLIASSRNGRWRITSLIAGD